MPKCCWLASRGAVFSHTQCCSIVTSPVHRNNSLRRRPQAVISLTCSRLLIFCSKRDGTSRYCDIVVLTVNRWRTVVSATWKYDDPRLNMSHEGAARVWHVQQRVVIFPFRTNYRVSYVLSSDQLQESWIICKLKSFSPLYLHDLILKTDDLYSVLV